MEEEKARTELKDESIAKITITKEAEKAVSEVVTKVNEKFEAGRVNRQDVASWILLRFKEICSSEHINQIRALHFDEVYLLEALLRRAKETGKVSATIKEALRAHLIEEPVKKSKKVVTSDIINDHIQIKAGGPKEDVA